MKALFTGGMAILIALCVGCTAFDRLGNKFSGGTTDNPGVVRIDPSRQPASTTSQQPSPITTQQPASAQQRPPASSTQTAHNEELKQLIAQLHQQIQELQAQQQNQQQLLSNLDRKYENQFRLFEKSVSDSLSRMNQNLDAMQDQQAVAANPSTNTNRQRPTSNRQLSTNTKNANASKEPKQSTIKPVETFNLFSRNQEADAETDVSQYDVIDQEDLEPRPLPPPDAVVGESGQMPESDAMVAVVPDTAEEEFKDPDLDEPKNPTTLKHHDGVKKLYNQGMVAIIQKNYVDAIGVFRNFYKQFPDDYDSDNAQYWIGHAYFNLNQLDKSEEAFRKVLRQYEHLPTSQGYKTPDSIYMLGRIYAKRNNTRLAKYYFKETIKRFPGSPSAKNAEEDLMKLGGNS